LNQALFAELAAQGEVKLVGTDSASWLGVPLKMSGRTIGVMVVQDYENDNRYSEREKDFLASIATQVALVIERKRAEEALRESEGHYRTIFEGVQDAIFVESLDGRILMVNERACEMFGYSQAEFLTKTVSDLVPAGHPTLSVNESDFALSTEPRETVNQRANGEIFPIEISGRVQVINGEQVLLVVVRDITERKQVEEELKRSHSLLHAALESTADGILVVESNGEISNFNQKFLELWRIPLSLAEQRDDGLLLQFVLSQLKDPSAFRSKVEALYQSPEETSFDELEFQDGRIFERYSQPQQVGSAVVGRVWSFRDITERKKAEMALLESNDRFRTLFEASPDAIVLIDPHDDWPIIDCNTAACQMNGYTREELVGQPVDIFNLRPSDVEGRGEYLESIRQAGVLHFEEFHQRKDGSVIAVDVSTSLITFGTRELVLGIDRDITERKHAENQLRFEKERFDSITAAVPGIICSLRRRPDGSTCMPFARRPAA
jgi:two-component system sensor histidine kinase/response regulator